MSVVGVLKLKPMLDARMFKIIKTLLCFNSRKLKKFQGKIRHMNEYWGGEALRKR